MLEKWQFKKDKNMKHIRGPQNYDYGYHALTTMDNKEQNTLSESYKPNHNQCPWNHRHS